jgi:hypothetical protein
VHLEASTKPHVHQKFQIFWTNIALTMPCPNFKNGPKNGLGPLRVKVAWIEVCLANFQTAHDLYGLSDSNLDMLMHLKNDTKIEYFIFDLYLKIHQSYNYFLKSCFRSNRIYYYYYYYWILYLNLILLTWILQTILEYYINIL